VPLSKKYAQAGLALPQMLTLALTDACNLDCAHCWVESDRERALDPVPTAVLEHLIGDFVALGGTSLQLTGGEPLLHPDWRLLLSEALGAGLEQVVLQTNGLLLGQSDLDYLATLGAGLRIQLSLDGANPQTHDLVRGSGTFAATLAVLQRLARAGLAPRVSLFFTEMQHNLHELPELLALAEWFEIPSLGSGTLVCGGRAAENAQIRPPRSDQYLNLLDRYREDAEFQRRYTERGSTAAIEWSRGAGEGGCCEFVATPYLSASGLLYPCLMCRAEAYAVSGVFGSGLRRALDCGIPRWRELQQIRRQRATTVAACRGCELNDSCAAGCIGRVWGSCADFQVVEDRCAQRLAVHRWQKKNFPG